MKIILEKMRSEDCADFAFELYAAMRASDWKPEGVVAHLASLVYGSGALDGNGAARARLREGIRALVETLERSPATLADVAALRNLLARVRARLAEQTAADEDPLLRDIEAALGDNS